MGKVIALIGFDCDRPRGNYIFTFEGNKIANEKFSSLNYIHEKLEHLHIPRTYFICGQFLESMISVFGEEAIRNVYHSSNNLVEIGDHSYSHNPFKPIKQRPDKSPTLPSSIAKEFLYNTTLFSAFFGKDLGHRGMRAPLGYYKGLQDADEVLRVLVDVGVMYISSDLRQKEDYICPPLVDEQGLSRQPYFYSNGLLEIPSHGWHDTAFGGLSKTPCLLPPPSNFQEVIEYYYSLFSEAKKISRNRDAAIYLGLVMHPYNLWQYDTRRSLFEELLLISRDMDIGFQCYKDAYYDILKSGRTTNSSTISK